MNQRYPQFRNAWLLMLTGVLFTACNKDGNHYNQGQSLQGQISARLIVVARQDTSFYTSQKSIELFADTSSQYPIVHIEWRQLSGPSATVIANAAKLRTTVSDFQPGFFMYEIRVTDSRQMQTSDTVKILVKYDFLRPQCVAENTIVGENLEWIFDQGFGACYQITIKDYLQHSGGVNPCRVMYVDHLTGDTTHVQPLDSTGLNFPYYYIRNADGDKNLYIHDWPDSAAIRRKPKAIVFY